MNIAIRVDASVQTGTGHFMRCLTLANSLKKEGGISIKFISAKILPHLKKTLVHFGYELSELEQDDSEVNEPKLEHSHWLGMSQESDAFQSIQALGQETWEWMIVDHYSIDCQWENILKEKVKYIMVIDDLADRNHHCDILLDKVPAHCKLLLGPQNALLRDEFWLLRTKAKIRSAPIKKILIFFGGIDAENYTNRVLQLISEIDTNFCVDVVIGGGHAYSREIEVACALHNYNFNIQIENMAGLMMAADLFIGAGGGAILERLMMKLPSITIATARNQMYALKCLEKAGASAYIGYGDELSDSMIMDGIKKALSNYSHLAKRSNELCEEYFSAQAQELPRLLIGQFD
jgi:UDP-2,4-diacetamido-2,4,6-trideoxy-beta-L-altropyranose hydrolase